MIIKKRGKRVWEGAVVQAQGHVEFLSTKHKCLFFTDIINSVVPLLYFSYFLGQYFFIISLIQKKITFSPTPLLHGRDFPPFFLIFLKAQKIALEKQGPNEGINLTYECIIASLYTMCKTIFRFFLFSYFILNPKRRRGLSSFHAPHTLTASTMERT